MVLAHFSLYRFNFLILCFNYAVLWMGGSPRLLQEKGWDKNGINSSSSSNNNNMQNALRKSLQLAKMQPSAFNKKCKPTWNKVLPFKLLTWIQNHIQKKPGERNTQHLLDSSSCSLDSHCDGCQLPWHSEKWHHYSCSARSTSLCPTTKKRLGRSMEEQRPIKELSGSFICRGGIPLNAQGTGVK